MGATKLTEFSLGTAGWWGGVVLILMALFAFGAIAGWWLVSQREVLVDGQNVVVRRWSDILIHRPGTRIPIASLRQAGLVVDSGKKLELLSIDGSRTAFWVGLWEPASLYTVLRALGVRGVRLRNSWEPEPGTGQNTRRVAISRLSPALVRLENDGDKFTVEGSWAWDELVKSALRSALVGRAVCVVERKHTGPLLVRSMGSIPLSRAAESKWLNALCVTSFSAFDADAVVGASEWEARWLWIVMSQDPSAALEATDRIARLGDSIDLNQLPTTAQALMSMHDGTELWWLNAPPEAEALLTEVASRLEWLVVSDFGVSDAE